MNKIYRLSIDRCLYRRLNEYTDVEQQLSAAQFQRSQKVCF